MDEVQVIEQPLDPPALLAALSEGLPGDCGGLATFLGRMRDRNDGQDVRAMTLEHYPGMTERVIEELVAEARRRWPLLAVQVVHRAGYLRPHDPIVWVAVAAAHREPAFAACEYLMDFLKTRAPFWKREELPDGARWVPAREPDEERAAGWQG